MKLPSPKSLPRHQREIVASHAAVVRAIEVATDEGIVASEDLDAAIVNSLPLQTCFARDKRYSFKSPKNLLPKRARALHRISRCRAGFWFTCRLLSMSAFRERSNQTANASAC